MRVRIIVVVITLFCLVGVSSASATSLWVDDDTGCGGKSPCYSSIQSAINEANRGDTVIVRDGAYYENLNVNKQLEIHSENGSTNCIVDGSRSGNVITLGVGGITVEGFTILNSGSWPKAGIKIYTNANTITNNRLSNSGWGIHLWGSSGNTITNNRLSNNYYGIYLWGSSYYSSDNNHITNNYISNNDVGIRLEYSSDNKIYLNNFIDNFYAVYSYNSTNMFNSTNQITYTYDGSIFTNCLGNYWDDYTGSDISPEDGIGDTPYSIDGNKDNYPLMQTFEPYFVKYNAYDANQDCYMSMGELFVAINDWKIGTLEMGPLYEVIELWKQGEYC